MYWKKRILGTAMCIFGVAFQGLVVQDIYSLPSVDPYYLNPTKIYPRLWDTREQVNNRV